MYRSLPHYFLCILQEEEEEEEQISYEEWQASQQARREALSFRQAQIREVRSPQTLSNYPSSTSRFLTSWARGALKFQVDSSEFENLTIANKRDEDDDEESVSHNLIQSSW